MDWNHKQRHRAAVESLARGLAGTGPTPTELAAREYAAATSGPNPWNGRGISERTRRAHLYCEGGCGVPNDPDHPLHRDHAEGCGTHSRKRCGGRWWSNRYPMSLVANTDATLLLSRKGWTR